MFRKIVLLFFLFSNAYAFCQNSTGKVDTNCSFKNIGKFHNGYAWAWNKSELYIINTKCEIKFTVKYVWGERSAAFFDSVIVIYAMKKDRKSYSVIDYSFNVLIPHDYCEMLKSNSERYYFVSKPCKDDDYKSLWGIYDIVKHTEVVPCMYVGSLGGQFGTNAKESTYSLNVDKELFKEMEKYNITLPPIDEISNRINEIYN